MLHAEIRWARDAFHLFGEMDAYNLQTLRQHVLQVLGEDERVEVKIELAAEDWRLFERQTRRWIAQLQQRGAIVAVKVDPADSATSGDR